MLWKGIRLRRKQNQPLFERLIEDLCLLRIRRRHACLLAYDTPLRRSILSVRHAAFQQNHAVELTCMRTRAQVLFCVSDYQRFSSAALVS